MSNSIVKGYSLSELSINRQVAITIYRFIYLPTIYPHSAISQGAHNNFSGNSQVSCVSWVTLRGEPILSNLSANSQDSWDFYTYLLCRFQHEPSLADQSHNYCDHSPIDFRMVIVHWSFWSYIFFDWSIAHFWYSCVFRSCNVRLVRVSKRYSPSWWKVGYPIST